MQKILCKKLSRIRHLSANRRQTASGLKDQRCDRGLGAIII